MCWSLTRRQEIDGPGAQGLVARVGATVRDTGMCIGVIHDLRHRLGVCTGRGRKGEFRPQVLVQGEIQHGVHRVFPRHGGQLADSFPLILVIPWVPDLDDTHLAPV